MFEAAKQAPKRRIVYAEGEDERVLRAAQTLVDDGIAAPILLGRRDVIACKIRDMGLRIDLADGVRVIDPAQDDEVFGPLIAEYQRLAGRRGVPPEVAGTAHPDAALGRRRDAAAYRPGGCRDLRRHRQLVAADPVHPADHPAAARCEPCLSPCRR